MKGLPWYKCFPRDFNEGMIGLSLEERGAYVTLLNLIYQRGGPVPDDAGYFRALLDCTPRTWVKVRAGLIARGKLFAVNFNGVDCLMNQRAANELAERGEISEMRSETGKRGGQKTQANNKKINDITQANANQTPTKSQAIQITDVRLEDANASLSPPSDDEPNGPKYPPLFEALWKAYPHVRGRSSKPKSLGHWRRLPSSKREALPAAATRFGREGREPKAECGAPALDRWLRDAKFEDWLSPVTPTLVVAETPEARTKWEKHYRDTGEWKPWLGPKPTQENAA